MGTKVTEPAEPRDALGLIRSQVLRKVVGRDRFLQQLVLPSAEVLVEPQGPHGGMIKQRQQQVTRHFPVLRLPVFGEIRHRRVISNDALTRQNDRPPARLEEKLLFVALQLVAPRLESPIQAKGLPVGPGFSFGVHGNLELLVAEDI